MINSLDVKFVKGKAEVFCTDCRSELFDVLTFVKSERLVCPHCGHPIDRAEYETIHEAAGSKFNKIEAVVSLSYPH